MPVITVKFRGICLFVVKGSKLTEVLLPEAEDGKPREHDSAGRHLDHSDTNRHFARLWVPGDSNRPSLKRKTVTITAEGATTAPTANIGKLPQLPNNELVLDRDQDHTSIKIVGGQITTAKTPNGRTFEYERQPDRHDMVDIAFNSTVSIKIGSSTPTVLKADRDREAFIYNFDIPRPSRTLLETGNETNEKLIDDDDFKWHYLLAAPPGSDPDKLLKWRRGFLPCPQSISTKTIAGSTCYPAAYTE